LDSMRLTSILLLLFVVREAFNSMSLELLAIFDTAVCSTPLFPYLSKLLRVLVLFLGGTATSPFEERE
jgi:hypothetical protein